MMLLTYKIQNKNLFLNDLEESERDTLKFHIKSDDYFRTLAAELQLLQEDKLKEKIQNKNFNNIIGHLEYLQKYYKITKK